MKKLLLIGLVTILTIFLVACGDDSTEVARLQAELDEIRAALVDSAPQNETTPVPELDVDDNSDAYDSDLETDSEAENGSDIQDAHENAAPQSEQTATPQSGEIEYEVTVVQEQFFESRTDEFTYQTLFQVYNTGVVPIYLGRSRFDLIDQDERILSADNVFSANPAIIHPGERGYLWASERIVGATTNTEVTITPRFDFNRSLHYRPNIEITNIEVRENPNRFIDDFIVFGRINNTTGSEMDRIDITVVLYTHDGSPIGVWTTTIRDIPAGESFGFEANRSNTTIENLTTEIVGDFTAFAVDFWQQNR